MHYLEPFVYGVEIIVVKFVPEFYLTFCKIWQQLNLLEHYEQKKFSLAKYTKTLAWKKLIHYHNILNLASERNIYWSLIGELSSRIQGFGKFFIVIMKQPLFKGIVKLSITSTQLHRNLAEVYTAVNMRPMV